MIFKIIVGQSSNLSLKPNDTFYISLFLKNNYGVLLVIAISINLLNSLTIKHFK